MRTSTKNFLLIVILLMFGFQTVSAFPPTPDELRKGFYNFSRGKQNDDFGVFLDLVSQYQSDLVKKAKDEGKTLKEVSEYIFQCVDAFGFSFFEFSSTFIAVDHSKLRDFSSGYFPPTENIAEVFLNHFGINSQTKEEKFISEISNFVYKKVFVLNSSHHFLSLKQKFESEMNFLNLTPKPRLSDSILEKKRRIKIKRKPELSSLSLSSRAIHKSDSEMDSLDSTPEPITEEKKQITEEKKQVTKEKKPIKEKKPKPQKTINSLDRDLNDELFTFSPTVQTQQKSNQDYVIPAKNLFPSFGLNEDELLDDKSFDFLKQTPKEKLILKDGKTVELISKESLPLKASYICPRCGRPVEKCCLSNRKGENFTCDSTCQERFCLYPTIILDSDLIIKKTGLFNTVSWEYLCFLCGKYHRVPMIYNISSFSCENSSFPLCQRIYYRIKNEGFGLDGFGFNELTTIPDWILQKEGKIKKPKSLKFKCPNPHCNKKEQYDKDFDLQVTCKCCLLRYHKVPYSEDKKCPHCGSNNFFLAVGRVTNIHRCKDCGGGFYL